MRRSDDPGSGHQRAIDQLVDEICQRLAHLCELVDTPLLEPDLSVKVIRRHAGDVVDRLTAPQARDTAVLVARALWPAEADEGIPLWWRATPLGVMIAAALGD